MPAFRSRTVLELARNLRAFLTLEAGLTRGQAPDAERELRRLRGRVEAQARELKRLRRERSEEAPGGGSRHAGPRPSDDGTHEPIRVVHLALDAGPSGAGRAAHKLHLGLRRLGHDSSMFVAEKRGDYPLVRAYEPPDDPRSRAARARREAEIRRDFARYEDSRPKDMIGYGFTGDRGVNGPELLEQLPPCDVLNLHWFGDFVDYRTLFGAVPRSTPVVWTVHDMNAFTGGCHYDAGCGRFASAPGCGACPQLGSDDEGDLSRQNWLRKREAFAGVGEDRLRLVAVSRWMAGEVGRSSLLGRFPVTAINPSIDAQTFAPRDRLAARDALGIPQNAAVLLFVADSLVTRRKGFALLAEAISGLKDAVPDLFLLSLGHHDPGIVGGVPHLNLGYIDDDLRLSGIYGAADVFVMPSLQEAFGQTVLEAMACGTPTVGFDVGGLPDMVRPGVTGELVPPFDVDALRDALKGLLSDPGKRSAFSKAGRRVAVEEFTHDAQAGRYLELYRSMIGAGDRR